MSGPGNLAKVKNVFVLMLENHSFDNIFAFSDIECIHVATPSDTNSYEGKAYTANGDAPPSMTTDPGHEFDDVLEQLCGKDAACKYTGGSYPKVTNSGFVSSYATSTSEDTGKPAPEHIGDIMACFDTPRKLPVINALAKEYAICDHWYSSIPGPTWPNRFFVHGASSSGWTESPTLKNEATWELCKGFTYKNGSIFDALSSHNHDWRLYQDKLNDFSDTRSDDDWIFGGWISQVASLKGVSLLDVHSLRRFKDDLHALDANNQPAYTTPYTFIEPNFGKSFLAPQKWFGGRKLGGPTYKSGSSQHPEDDPSGGEGLIKHVYETIRNSPIWETSLLIIVYDEHGGFYDSVKPGCAATPEPENAQTVPHVNPRGFGFDQYGVRVPAVVVSPLIPKGTVDHTEYCHASVPKTLESWLDMPALTARDDAANDLGHLLSLKAPRDDADCPVQLPDPAKFETKVQPKKTLADSAIEDLKLPAFGNVIGFLYVLLKHEFEKLGCGEEAEQKVKKKLSEVSDHGQASDLAKEVFKQIEEASITEL